MSRNIMQDIAQYIAGKIGKKYGFVVLVFEFGQDASRMNYVSNAQRDDVVKALEEFIDETKNNWGTHKM